ncbi:glycosyltransferase [Prochlorococcus marinus]|uniref:glycosyltransferase n=1 Tax=Prochlorococcus marinus TaxID=1219 RepID=UPI001ADC0F4B|nr:glycosyltransferase [Prochlorococcus marinus]MBO8221395.1 glycosyltransferase [Prochlorococcus marinus CUG1417]MBW3074205.1 hypothetical protein [Prochlorococcus marinus str. MU1417]
MNYSFFGTCYSDHQEFFDCLQTILDQTISPKEIILVNSGEINIEKKILDKIGNKEIKLVYISTKVSRVKALNLAVDKSSSKYSFRFDTRSRFTKDYAENALLALQNKSLDAAVVGGVPKVISSSSEFIPKLCAEIMGRPYLYFFPKHRNINYSGYSASIYLGCFVTSILKNIRFNEKEDILSEDSLIINDFLERGFKAYISSRIKVRYICRSSFFNVLKLFNTYGFCRANTIFVSKKLFISKRHFYVFISLILIVIIFSKFALKGLFFLPVILLIFNLFNEIILSEKVKNLLIPIYGTLCQFSWILGFSWRLLTIFKTSISKSNFIS